MTEHINPNRLYRIPEKGKIAGVCAGLAEHFGIEVWLVRIAVVSLFFLGGSGIVLLLYVAACFILEKKLASEFRPPFILKSKVWQQGMPPRQAFCELNDQLTDLELRLRKLERYVTSPQFTLSREIDKL